MFQFFIPGCGTDNRCSYEKTECSYSKCRANCWSQTDTTTRSARTEVVWRCKKSASASKFLFTFDDGPDPFLLFFSISFLSKNHVIKSCHQKIKQMVYGRCLRCFKKCTWGSLQSNFLHVGYECLQISKSCEKSP